MGNTADYNLPPQKKNPQASSSGQPPAKPKEAFFDTASQQNAEQFQPKPTSRTAVEASPDETPRVIFRNNLNIYNEKGK